MAYHKALIKQADLKRILKAHIDAGIQVARTEVRQDGKVIVVTEANAGSEVNNDWDSQ